MKFRKLRSRCDIHGRAMLMLRKKDKYYPEEKEFHDILKTFKLSRASL